MNSKKAMELPINIVVMIIIGIILFGMGLALFGKLSGAGDEQIEDLSRQVKEDLGRLECRGDNWICAPTMNIKLSDKQSSYIYVANRGSQKHDFSVQITSSTMTREDESGKIIFTKDDTCGSIVIAPFTGSLTIESGSSAGFPFQVFTSRTIKEACSFTLLASTQDQNGEVQKTPLIISVE